MRWMIHLWRQIANTCRANGLEAITDEELLASKDLGDALWEALAESRALLVVLSRPGLTPSMAIELGVPAVEQTDLRSSFRPHFC